MATPTDAPIAPTPSQSQSASTKPTEPPQTNGTPTEGSASKAAPVKSAMKKPAATETDPDGTPKLSGAELKKRAKEEKAARRAAEKAAKDVGGGPGGPVSGKGPQQGGGKEAQKTGQQAAKDASKPGHKRTGSQTASLQGQPLAIRGKGGAVGSPVQATKEKKTAAKEVGLFGHLYTQPKRMTLEGVSKEVHPAVLALGFQMSNYEICGSNARCVAMLLAFKRVIDLLSFRYNIADFPPGNSSLHNPPRYSSIPPHDSPPPLASNRLSQISPSNLRFNGQFNPRIKRVHHQN